jgi:hypothetical protein
MTNQVPLAAKIRFLQSQIDMTQQILVTFDLNRPQKYPGEHNQCRGFQWQEEVLMAILADYKQVEKDMAKQEFKP